MKKKERELRWEKEQDNNNEDKERKKKKTTQKRTREREFIIIKTATSFPFPRFNRHIRRAKHRDPPFTFRAVSFCCCRFLFPTCTQVKKKRKKNQTNTNNRPSRMRVFYLIAAKNQQRRWRRYKEGELWESFPLCYWSNSKCWQKNRRMAASEREDRKKQIEKKRRRLDESGRLVRAVKSIGLSATKRDPRLLLDYYLPPCKKGKKKGKKCIPRDQFPNSHVRTFARKTFFFEVLHSRHILSKRFSFPIPPPYPHPFCLIFRKAAMMPLTTLCVVVDDDVFAIVKRKEEEKKIDWGYFFCRLLTDWSLYYVFMLLPRIDMGRGQSTLSLYSLCIA